MVRTRRKAWLPCFIAAVTYVGTAALLWHGLPWRPRASAKSPVARLQPLGFLADGHSFATCQGVILKSTTSVQVWDAVSAVCQTSYSVTANRGLRLGPDGSLLIGEHVEAVKGRGAVRTIRLIDASSGDEYAAIEIPADPVSHLIGATLSDDGKTLAFPEMDQKESCVRLWDVASKQTVVTLPAARSPIAFSSDGAYVATAGVERGACKLWDRMGALVRTFRIDKGGPQAFVITEGNRTLVAETVENPQPSAPADLMIRRWDIATGKETADHEYGHFLVRLGADRGFGFYRYDPTTGKGVDETLVAEDGLRETHLPLTVDVDLKSVDLSRLLPVPGTRLAAMAWVGSKDPNPYVAKAAKWLRMDALTQPHDTGAVVFYDVENGSVITNAPIPAASAFISADGQTLATLHAIDRGTVLNFWDIPPHRPYVAIFTYSLAPAGLLFLATQSWSLWRKWSSRPRAIACRVSPR